MNDVTIRLEADADSAVKELKSVDNALDKLQQTAQDTADATREIVPPPNTTKKSTEAVKDLARSVDNAEQLTDLLAGQSMFLSAGLRILVSATRDATTGTVGFIGALKAAGVAMKSFFVNMGPLGWAILGIAAAVTACTSAFNYFKKATKEAKEAAEDFANSTKTQYSQLASQAAKYYRQLGEEHKASAIEAKQTMLSERAEAQKTLEEQLAAIEKMRVHKSKEERLIEQTHKIHRRTMALIDANYYRELATLEQEAAEETETVVDQEAEAKKQAAANIIEHLEKQIDTYKMTNAELLKHELILNGVEEAYASFMAEKQQAFDNQKDQDALIDSLLEEQEVLGLSNAELIKRKMLLAGASEEQAEEVARIRESIDARTKELETTKNHGQTMQDLNWELAYQAAVLDDNTQEMRKLNIEKKMATGLTRDQAIAELEATAAIAKNAQAIAEMNANTATSIAAEKELQNTRKVSLTQLYNQLQTGSQVELETSDSSQKRSSTSSQTGSGSSSRNDSTTLKDLLDVLLDIKNAVNSTGIVA